MATAQYLFKLCILFIGLFLTGCNAKPVIAQHAMVVTEQAVASQVGVDILRQGGNAVDAAVAIGYALAVVNPCCGNIGGGGFMIIHLTNNQQKPLDNTIVLNFREKAPSKANKNMFLDAQQNVISGATLNGYLSVAVPGTVLGLDTALEKYGTITRTQVMAPAIHLARQGYIVTPTDAKWFKVYADDFRQQPNVAAIFLKNGRPYRAGEILKQTDLANTLQQIADKGPVAFYKGPIAKKIVAASEAQGGILTLKDFAHYDVQTLAPVRCNYHEYTIYSAPPPSAGGVMLCEALNILENFSLKSWGRSFPLSVRDTVEAMRYSFIDRAKLADPNFVENPIKELISKSYAYQLSKKIQESFHAPVNQLIDAYPEFSDTTHYSVVDSQKNAVAVTYTINGFFGARIIAGDTGFFLNDEMDDFSAKKNVANKFGLVQSERNNIAPDKRPLSSMMPTIITKNGQVFMVLGSPGGSRIVTAVLLTILNVIDYGMNIQEAVNAPRFHYQVNPEVIASEPFALLFTTKAILRYWGYPVACVQQRWSAVEAIVIDPQNGALYGGSDCRREAGKAVGF